MVLALAGLGTPAAAGAVDVTDEAAVVAAYNAQSGWTAEVGDLCIVTDPDFPGVAAVGTAPPDRGCAVELVLVDGQWLAPGAAASPVLLGRGWQDASPETRAALAMDWVRFAVFPFHGFPTEPGEDFALDGAPEFAAPIALADAQGGAVVTAWVREPPGMLAQTVYKLWELTFDAGGKQARTRVLADYEVNH
ncbi:MAG: hypothetical protein ACFCVH_22945 [Alphaproteobacteria bacterium]